jgi:hypothetical protein
MYNRNSEEEIIRQLDEELPQLLPEDVVSLIATLEKIQDEKKDKFYFEKENQSHISSWAPHRSLIKEIIDLGVEPCFIPKVIRDFHSYASTKKWTPQDNLDSKFMTHVKFLIQCGRISISSENTSDLL